MSIDLGEIHDALDGKQTLLVAVSSGKFYLCGTVNKIWFTRQSAKELIELIETAMSYDIE